MDDDRPGHGGDGVEKMKRACGEGYALSLNERRLLAALAPLGREDAVTLGRALGATGDAVVQYASLLAQNGGLATVERKVETSYSLTEEGHRYASEGLPERQLLSSFEERATMAELKGHPLASIGIGWLRRKGWVTIRDGIVEKTGDASEGEDEQALASTTLVDGPGLRELLKRGLAVEQESVGYTVSITEAGLALAHSGLDLREEVGQLTHEMLLTGSWRTTPLRRYRVDRVPRRLVPGKVHPYQRLLDEMRTILQDMGFVEMGGGLVQSGFWNFDALFQPQDHPAREMQDTFHLGGEAGLPPGWERVRAMHEHGGATTSTGWGGVWQESKGRQQVLRTHLTGLSIQYLASHPTPPVKAFAIGRVFRREAIDPTHLPEFEQLEGIVMDEGVTFSHLLGFLREFYRRLGFPQVRFRPGYFPYTEPSVEPEVFVDGLGWVELGGAGVFREEVTAPFGIEHPVLAWGLGASRLAMLRLGLKDLRQLYRSDIDWCRETPIHPGRGGQ
ncbi:Phenylalanine--tRNA ligase alpha subunit [anaerobic digester metagenome]